MQDKLKAFEKKFNEAIVVEKNPAKYKEMYEVILTWDSNDADYVDQTATFTKEGFENDIALKLVLSFIAKGQIDDEPCLFEGNWNTPRYGHYIEENKRFRHLDMYLGEMYLYAHCDHGPCHSVDKIKISYFDADGKIHLVTLPDFDSLFETKEEALEMMDEVLAEYAEYLADEDNEMDGDDED